MRTFKFRRIPCLLAIFCIAFAIHPAAAEEPEKTPTPKELATPVDIPASDIPGGDLWSDDSSKKSYLIPALDIIGFDLLLNQYNRHWGEAREDYRANWNTIKRNFNSSWKEDSDSFQINQLGHPYQGSMYHGFSRSAGLSYWESLGYTVAGSYYWEIAGEATPPSRNDMVATGIGGSFLGESLFRMSSLLLEHPGKLSPFWREAGAAVISPSTGFNRLAFEDRFDEIFSSHDAVYYSRMQLGASNTVHSDRDTSREYKANDAQADFIMEYGVPGKPGYDYTRPFDYFVFQGTASSANTFENIMTRGLLLGKSYEVGDSYRGLWGLYGSYDYISPQTYRVSSTALSLGTTGQLWLTDKVALQGTAMGGMGYAAVGTLKGLRAEEDYHYGVAPQALAALRVIFGNRASLDITGREYFVTGVDDANRGGHDNILRADIAFTTRVVGNHGLSIKYLWNQRDATYDALGDRSQITATLGLYYTYLGDDAFGAVDWR